jgi:glycosyltransferase involved in cell wall biosynthesis
LKLLLICWGDPFASQAGTEIYIGHLAIELAKRGHEVHVLYGGKEHSDLEGKNLITHSIHPINFSYIRGLDFRRKCADICNELMRESEIDAVIASGSGTFPGYIFSRLKKLRKHLLVYYAMDSMKMEYERGKLSTKSRWTFANLDRWIRYVFLIKSDESSCFYSDLILASSRDTANHLALDYGVLSSKVRVFYEGVPDDFAEGIEIVDPDIPVFLHVAGGPRKGTDYFLGALKLLKEKYALKTRAVITRANSTQTNQAKKLGIDTEVYSYLPYSKLKHLYSSSTALVSPSLSEGFCLPVIEAAMFGKPAIVSNAGSLPELVVDGENGFVVSVADATTLAERMYQIAVNDQIRRHMSEKARQLSQRFKISSTAQTLIQLLDNKLDIRETYNNGLNL